MAVNDDKRVFQPVTAIVKLAGALEKDSGFRTKIEWESLFDAVDGLLKNSSPDLSTPWCKAVELRARIDAWLQVAAELVPGLRHVPRGTRFHARLYGQKHLHWY